MIDAHKIIASDYTGRDISGLPDNPSDSGINATQLKARFDSLIKEVVAVKHNALIDELVTKIAELEARLTALETPGV